MHVCLVCLLGVCLLQVCLVSLNALLLSVCDLLLSGVFSALIVCVHVCICEYFFVCFCVGMCLDVHVLSVCLVCALCAQCV